LSEGEKIEEFLSPNKTNPKNWPDQVFGFFDKFERKFTLEDSYCVCF